MDYFKKILILKQVQEGFSCLNKPVSGIFRIEIESGVATLHLTLINLAPVNEGEYVLFIYDKNELLLSIELGKSPLSLSKALSVCPDIKENLSVGVSFIKDGIPLLIAYANSDNIPDMSALKKKIIDKCIAEKKYTKPLKTPSKEIETPPTPPPENYNDEVVATENYFLLDEGFNEKLKKIERIDNELLRNENDFPFKRSKEKTGENPKILDCLKDEKDASSCKEREEEQPYFLKVKAELDEIFEKFPEETSLSKTLPFSKWAKIFYSENKFYVVGVIYKSSLGEEKYICYGVPDKYSLNPPKELKGFCSFIPLSVFDMTGDGYWMMFQDASTGECIKKPN